MRLSVLQVPYTKLYSNTLNSTILMFGAGALGLGIYESDSEDEGDMDASHGGGDSDSDEELRRVINSKKRSFAKKSEEIRDRIEKAQAEEERRKAAELDNEGSSSSESEEESEGSQSDNINRTAESNIQIHKAEVINNRYTTQHPPGKFIHIIPVKWIQ